MGACEKAPLERVWLRELVDRLEILLNVLNQMCIGFVTIYMTWLCFHNGLGTMELHAWLVTIGFTLLMAEGMMCHYTGNVMTLNAKRSTRTTIHWVLLVLGGGCGVAGCLIMLIPEHFKIHSTHGKLGFSAFVLCLVSLLSGLLALFAARLRKVARISPLLNKACHNILGIAIFAVALTAQWYGYYFFRHKVDAGFLVLLRVFSLVSLVLTCVGPLKSLFQKFSSMASV